DPPVLCAHDRGADRLGALAQVGRTERDLGGVVEDVRTGPELGDALDRYRGGRARRRTDADLWDVDAELANELGRLDRLLCLGPAHFRDFVRVAHAVRAAAEVHQTGEHRVVEALGVAHRFGRRRAGRGAVPAEAGIHLPV